MILHWSEAHSMSQMLDLIILNIQVIKNPTDLVDPIIPASFFQPKQPSLSLIILSDQSHTHPASSESGSELPDDSFLWSISSLASEKTFVWWLLISFDTLSCFTKRIAFWRHHSKFLDCQIVQFLTWSSCSSCSVLFSDLVSSHLLFPIWLKSPQNTQLLLIMAI